jgi:hypothetical protein
MRDRRLQGIQAVIEWQQRMPVSTGAEVSAEVGT